ncbi:DHH family phosphoesterase [Clostridium fallax]|uniref:DDH domain-containing protein n=1 Tax=Clostridium fallax TaxID=1533 RepID=A0A1M4UC04_9CLOT|nr:DHH family phosphoesterase [Clostridium fallax]SHE54245.1 hypothetical protein SAMN05443638_104139 [Clostridium fallax]SQB06181.1 DHH domain-containing protein [Clostridium fallax]
MQKFWESIYRPNYINGYNPFIIKNMNKAIERTVTAINHREKIVLYGSCDVDGICGIASLILMLKYLNADVEYFIDEGNGGLNSDILKNHIGFLGAQLVITVGCGLNNIKKQEALCKELGIDIIVTENKKTKDKYESIYINPSQECCGYRYKNLSSCGVSFKLMQAIAIYYNMKSINRYLDLILLGGISAGIENIGENRIFLKEGMNYLKTTNNNGLRAILDYSSIKDINSDSIRRIISIITPTVNPVGKKESARIIVELLTTNDKDRSEQIVKYLYSERKRELKLGT